MSSPIRLMLVDDQALVRAGFRMVLDAQPDMEVVAEAADGQEALDLLDRHAVDVVLMDVRMPRMDGVSATQHICSRTDPPRVVVLTTFDLDEYAFAALQAGAAGFLLKDAGPADLLSAVRAVSAGDAVVAPSTTRRLLEHFVTDAAKDTATDAGAPPSSPGPAPSPESHPRLAELTPRELEVLTAIGNGLSNAEICAQLFLAEGTVKTHIGHLLAKCEARDRVQLVVLAYESGLVQVRPRS